jgi:hypothetical protein
VSQVTSSLSFDIDPTGALEFVQVLVTAAVEVRARQAAAA